MRTKIRTDYQRQIKKEVLSSSTNNFNFNITARVISIEMARKNNIQMVLSRNFI